MSTFIACEGRTDGNNKEYAKHLEIVEFCISKNVSCPKETVNFFLQTIGEDINNYQLEYFIDTLKGGEYVDITNAVIRHSDDFITININELPKNISIVNVKIDW